MRLQNARQRMHQVFSDNQLIGRTLTTGCTAVEITKRCHLDCTLCYLSENSELVTDPPIEEVFRRLENIRATYGARTNVLTERRFVAPSMLDTYALVIGT